MSTTTVPAPVKERVLRGIAIAADQQVQPLGHGHYEVAGTHGWTYEVNLDVFSDDPHETCGCPDYRRHKRTGTVCKHITAATIYRAKSRTASRRTRLPKLSPDVVAASLDRMGA